MGYETEFVVFEPKTGQEIFEQIKSIDDKLGPKSENKDNFQWKLTKEIWAVFKSSLLNGTLEIPNREDNSVCPSKVHRFLCLLDDCYHEITSNYLFEESYCTYHLEEIFNGYEIGRWAKACWVLDAPLGAGIQIVDEDSTSLKNYETVELFAFEFVLRKLCSCFDLSNLSTLTDEQLKVFLDVDSHSEVPVGFEKFPEEFLQLKNTEIVFTKPVEISVKVAEEIEKARAAQFKFPLGSTNHDANSVLKKLRDKQTLNLNELCSIESQMIEHFQASLEETNQDNLEFGLDEVTLEELISEEGGDWIDGQREIPVNYVASDALEKVKELQLSFFHLVDLTSVPKTKGKLTLKDAILFYCQLSEMSRLESDQLGCIENHYRHLIEQMEETGEFQVDESGRFDGISKEEYCGEEIDLDYYYTSSQDEEFLNSAKLALKEGKLIYFWTA